MSICCKSMSNYSSEYLNKNFESWHIYFYCYKHLPEQMINKPVLLKPKALTLHVLHSFPVPPRLLMFQRVSLYSTALFFCGLVKPLSQGTWKKLSALESVMMGSTRFIDSWSSQWGDGVFAIHTMVERKTVVVYFSSIIHTDLPKQLLSMKAYDKRTMAISISALTVAT